MSFIFFGLQKPIVNIFQTFSNQHIQKTVGLVISNDNKKYTGKDNVNFCFKVQYCMFTKACPYMYVKYKEGQPSWTQITQVHSPFVS